MEYSIKIRKGLILRGIIKSPGENIRAMVLLVHGLGEHTGRWNHWADLFNEQGIGVTGVDLPGHGRSEGSRGHIRNYGVTDEIIGILINETSKTFPGIPLILYGHSLGGGIVIDHIIRKNPAVRMAVVTSPWLRLSFEPPRHKLVLAAIASRLLPSLVQPSGLEVRYLSRDESVVKAYTDDPLVHDRISAALFHNAMRAAAHSLSNPEMIGLPLLLVHGGDDMICSISGSSALAERNKNVELKIWPGGFHELHNEPDRAAVFSYIIGWIENQLR